jgi:macrolide transport system ATP-binding/permease protein
LSSDEAGAGPVISFRGVERDVPVDGGRTRILGPVSFDIDAGALLAITGPSGSGKSTMLNILGLLDRPTGGTYLLRGEDMGTISDEQRSAIRCHRLGFVFQSFHLLSHKNALDNVQVPLVHRGVRRAERVTRARAALERVGLSHRLDAYPQTLSGGEQQRVAVARALVGDPTLILCDEPTGNLDSKNAAMLLDLLDELHRDGLTVVIVTHDEAVAGRATRRLSLRDGGIVDDTLLLGVPTAAGAITAEVADELRRPRLRAADLVSESGAASSRRSGRTILTLAATGLGVGALIATAGIAASASTGIDDRFRDFQATEVVLTDSTATERHTLPSSTDNRLRQINGVVAGGRLCKNETAMPVQLAADSGAGSSESTQLEILAASPGAVAAMELGLRDGRTISDLDDSLAASVAILGSGAAGQLNIASTRTMPTISIDGRRFLVIGIADDAKRHPAVLTDILIPATTQEAYWGPTCGEPAEALIATAQGAAQAAGRYGPLVVYPDDPTRLLARVPPDPRRLRQAVRREVVALEVGLGVVSLVLGAMSIASRALSAVVERTPEIGLRRAVGARQRDIRRLFLCESALLGVVGAVIGVLLGLAVVRVVAGLQSWTPTIEPILVWMGPALGGITGVFGGWFPAKRASRVEPVTALRSG